MALRQPFRVLAGLAFCAVAASCVTTTDIGAGQLTAPDTAPPLDGASTASLQTEERQPPPPTPEPTEVPRRPTPVPLNAPDGWKPLESSNYTLALPPDWIGITNSFTVEASLEQLWDRSPEPYEIIFYSEFLSFGDSVVALSPDGDDLYAYTSIGNATSLRDPDRIGAQFASEVRTYGENVQVTTTTAEVNGNAGVLVSGTYDWDGKTFDVVHFVTHRGLTVYYLTISTVVGTNPGLADQILESLTLT